MKRLALALAGSLAAATAAADCTQGDIGGSWISFQSAGALGYQHCGLMVQANGRVLAGTTCVNADKLVSTIFGGQLTLDSSCRLHGSLINSFGTFWIDRGWLEPHKNVAAGVGKDSAQLPITFQAIRRPGWVGPPNLVGQIP